MNRLQAVERLSLVAFAAFAASCASMRPISVNVAAFSGGAASSIPPASTIALLENPKAENPLLEKELHAKLGRLLRERGYTLVPFDRAAFAVMAFYGIGAHTEIETTKESADIRAGISTVGSVDAYVPTTVTVNDRWLTVVALDVVQGRKENRAIQAWRGEAKSSGSTSDLRLVLDYMLIPVVDAFGKNQNQKPSVLLMGDKRVKALRTP